MDFHPIAALFPLIEGDEFAALVEDVKANGLREPIWTHDGKIIDGRNRYRACLAAGVAPRYRAWDGQGSLTAFVLSLNLHRRHLMPSQRSMVAVEVVPWLEREAADRRQETQGRPTADKLSQRIDTVTDRNSGRATEQAAQLLQTNRQYVHDAKKIAATAPEVAEQVRRGAVTIPQAKAIIELPAPAKERVMEQLAKGTEVSVPRLVKEAQREIKREENRELVKQAPAVVKVATVKYPTIVIDPPWDWGDEGDADQFGRARPDYATMTIDEIRALPVREIAADNAHIYMWITNRSLPKGFSLLEAWGFRYITTLTWCKPHFGMGNYFRGSTEHILFGVRGSLPLLNSSTGTWFPAKQPGPHSAKPDEFFSLVQECSPGPWIELFSRQQRNGWAAWGERSA